MAQHQDGSAADRLRAALEALARPLSWEERAGCADTVARGGLTAYGLRWIDEALAAAADEPLREAVEALRAPVARYSGATPAERRELLRTIGDLLERAQNAAAEHGRSWREVAQQRDAALDARAISDLRSARRVSVKFVKGVGPRIAELLSRLGVETAYDLLTLFPRKYQDRRRPTPVAELRDGDRAGTLLTIGAEPKASRGRRVVTIRCAAYDDTGAVQLTWFNQPWLVDKLTRGTRLYASGEVERLGRNVTIRVDEYEIIGPTPDPLQIGRIVPVYPLTEGLAQATVRRVVSQAIERYAHGDYDPVPVEVCRRRGLLDHAQAIRSIHFPASMEEQEEARRGLAYRELLPLQVEVARRRREDTLDEAVSVKPTESALAELGRTLPFDLTRAQSRAARQILRDMTRRSPMNRLLHGDVGSGKTVVIMAALLAVARSGHQAALMVPTEILAQQHYRNLRRLLGGLGVEVDLLIGGLSTAAKETVRGRLVSGLTDVVVGTHALIQDPVAFRSLALAVVDEQHRFGVAHRSDLVRKGRGPHFLVVTATPIPRTLALTVYGHLLVSVLDELPPGRRPVMTKLATRRTAYQLVRKEAEKGRQAYVICPLIEPSEALDCQAAAELAERLAAEELSGLRIGLLHGRLKLEERDRAMAEFVAGNSDALVSTSVVEVGVDVPNATVMVVENAERFGLAQLHQLRGRVGRGDAPSYCALISGTRTKEARERLTVLCGTTDGFKIAMEDLRLRGPGEFVGTRQSGMPDFRIADVLRDVGLLELAHEDAEAIIARDKELSLPEHADMAEEMKTRGGPRSGPGPVG